MAKRILWALICLVFTLTGYASQLTATLQSGDKLTPFYGSNAFVDAYNAAVDGDIITLSPGQFNSTTIAKSITIIGTYGFGDDTSKATRLGSTGVTTVITADNVTIEGVRASYFNIKGADNLTISRSEITYLDDEANGEKKYHDNTIVTDCMIARYRAMSLSKNTVLRNCAIDYFDDINESANLALIEDCNINQFARYNSGTSAYPYYQPYAIYRNNILRLYQWNDGSHSITFKKPSEFHKNLIVDVSDYASSSSYYSKWSINWGSVVNDNNIVTYKYSQSYGSANFGIDGTYGPVGHKEYPAIPVITSSKIDTETDDDGNIHVKISATARD